MIKDDCLFCKIAGGSIPSATVYEDSNFRVFMDVNPASRGHCLIVPREHFDDIYDLDAETAGKLFSLATLIARALKDALNCDGLNIVQNNGEIAGQTIHHFHLHLIPRYKGDDFSMQFVQHEISQGDLDKLRNEIRSALQ